MKGQKTSRETKKKEIVEKPAWDTRIRNRGTTTEDEKSNHWEKKAPKQEGGNRFRKASGAKRDGDCTNGRGENRRKGVSFGRRLKRRHSRDGIKVTMTEILSRMRWTDRKEKWV